MEKNIIYRNQLFIEIFRGKITGISNNIISYDNKDSWLSKKIDEYTQKNNIGYNIYYFNGESSIIDENNIMTLNFHLDVPIGGSDEPAVQKRLSDTKKIIYDLGNGGILLEGAYIKNGKWNDYDIVLEKQISATIKLTGTFVY